VDDLEGEEFAVYEYFSKEIKIMKAGEEFALQLKDGDNYKLYILAPLKNGCGIIGKMDKYISPATVRYNSAGVVELVKDGPYAYVENYELMLVN